MVGLKLTHNGEWTINDLLTILQFVVLLGGIIWAVAIMPQKVMSEVTTRFASRERVDQLQEDVSYMRGKIDRMYELLQFNNR